MQMQQSPTLQERADRELLERLALAFRQGQIRNESGETLGPSWAGAIDRTLERLDERAGPT